MTVRPDVIVIMTGQERAAPTYEAPEVTSWRRDALTGAAWFVVMQPTQIRLDRYPTGIPTDNAWTITHDTPPEPSDRHIEIDVQLISIDPGMKGWASTWRSYIDPVRPGDVMRAFDELCGRLTAEQLAMQSLCPDWDVRGVISHVIGVEHVLDGWAPSTGDPPPFERLGAFQSETADLDPSALATRVAEVTASRLGHLRSLDPSVVDAPSITPTGIATYGDFLRIRVFDLWVHARDIAIPMGERLGDGGAPAQMALDEIAGAIGYIVGKKVGLPDGMSIVFHVTGGVERDLAVVVDGRAGAVEVIPSPDVEVTADVETFVMLAAGRIDPQAQIDAGAITWSGDAEWGERAARNLAYTM